MCNYLSESELPHYFGINSYLLNLKPFKNCENGTYVIEKFDKTVCNNETLFDI